MDTSTRLKTTAILILVGIGLNIGVGIQGNVASTLGFAFGNFLMSLLVASITMLFVKKSVKSNKSRYRYLLVRNYLIAALIIFIIQVFGKY
jgi:hypothetical protein